MNTRQNSPPLSIKTWQNSSPLCKYKTEFTRTCLLCYSISIKEAMTVVKISWQDWVDWIVSWDMSWVCVQHLVFCFEFLLEWEKEVGTYLVIFKGCSCLCVQGSLSPEFLSELWVLHTVLGIELEINMCKASYLPCISVQPPHLVFDFYPSLNNDQQSQGTLSVWVETAWVEGRIHWSDFSRDTRLINHGPTHREIYSKEWAQVMWVQTLRLSQLFGISGENDGATRLRSWHGIAHVLDYVVLFRSLIDQI